MKDIIKLKYVCAMDRVYCALLDRFDFGVQDTDFLQKHFLPLYKKPMSELARKYGSVNNAKTVLNN